MEEMQLTLAGETPEQAEAIGLHYEIMSAAQTAASSLLDLGRKLKRMRDTGRYKALGFATFGDYTEQAVHIRQRQAYTYISVVEKLPAQLIEENAAAGITKLALLSKLGPQDREEVAGELANITVTELQALIDEKNGLAEQLSMLQETPAAEATAEEVDMEAELKKAADAARAEERAKGQATVDDLKKQFAKEKQELESAANQRAAKEAETARRDGEEKVRAKMKEMNEQLREMEEKYQRELKQVRQQAEEQSCQHKRTQPPADARFGVLFEELQRNADVILDMLETMAVDGKTEDAAKYGKALAGALRAMADQAEEAAGEEKERQE